MGGTARHRHFDGAERGSDFDGWDSVRQGTVQRLGERYDWCGWCVVGGVRLMGHVIHKFGRNPAVANGVWEDVWLTGGTYVWPQAGSVLHVFSSTAADTVLGAGARTVTVQGLSTAFEEMSETIDLAGTSTSIGSLNFQRVNRAFVDDAGTYAGLVVGGNKGTITINTAGGDALATIGVDTTVGLGQTEIARYTVPHNHVAFVKSIAIDVDAGKNADVAFFQRRKADVVAAPFTAKRLIVFFDGVLGHTDLQPTTPFGPFPEKTDLWMSAKGGGAATEVSANFEIVLFPEGQEPEFS